jgi:pimeloyl-ACP methyl ester carboxylesterase
VHGWGVDADQNWVLPGWVGALSSDRCVIALDVRGHGLSDKPHDPVAYTYAAMSADIIAVLDHLEIGRADYLGYSMGAFIGAYLLGHAADRFDTVVLAGIGDETDESAAVGHAIAAALRADSPASITDPVGLAYRSFVGANPHNDLEALAVSALTMWPDGYPVRIGGEGLSRVTNRVLIINGADDHPYVDTAPGLAAAISGAQLMTVPGLDHLQAVGDPGFQATVIDFLRA